MPVAKQKRKSRKPPDPAVAEKRSFTRLIQTLFTNLGFVHIKTEGKEGQFGHKTGELDAVFLFENVLLIVEETTATSPFDHAKNKQLLAEQVLASTSDFIDWLASEFPDHGDALSQYAASRFKVFFLYISKTDMELDDHGEALLAPMKVVTPRALTYFDKTAKTIRRSARTDLWRFLELESSDIGPANASNNVKVIETTIISPDDSTGFSNGVRLVSFMISADVLLRNCYVLRKDNWEYTTDLYQRLIDTNRIKKIREYVASGSAFLSNIIVGLPPDVTFQKSNKTPVALSQIQDFQGYRMTIPDEFNSLCLIDGQHRVFAHYEGIDDLEPTVAVIRGKSHLLATGLIFPAKMSELERLQLQSEIFLDINSNTKPVPADVLLAIQSIRAPFADVAIARRVLELLNKKAAFRGMFQLSQMDQAPIKVASIVKFALRLLVNIDSDTGLYTQWIKSDESREALRKKDDRDLLNEYVNYCAATLDLYFGALKASHADEWTDPESKITSTTVINAMIIALRRSLPALGVLTFDEYSALVKDWTVDFSKANFPFTSSQYARFSQLVLLDMFKLVEADGHWVKQ